MTYPRLHPYFAFYVALFLHCFFVLFLELLIPSATTACNRHRKVLDHSYGILSSGGREYPMDSHCEWLIKANHSRQHISLTFTKLDTECSYDHVYVYDGESYSSPLLGSFSGNASVPTVTAKHGAMLVLLYSDTNYVRAGFVAYYSITDCPLNCTDKGTCIDHQCACTPEFSGEACEIDLCPNDCGKVEGRGECVGKILNQKCSCHNGYSGHDCGLLDSNKNGGFPWYVVSPGGFPNKPRASHTGIYIESQDRLYLYGGYSFGVVYDDVVAYDFKHNEWLNFVVPHGPKPRRNHAAAAYGDHFVVFGGELEDNTLSNELWLFNTSSHQWHLLLGNSSILPPAIAKHTLSFVKDHWIYVFGGIFSNHSFSSLMYRTRLDDVAWEYVIYQGGGKMIRQVVGHTAIYYEPLHTIFIYGGVIVEFSHVSKLNNNIYAFHVGKKYWTRLNFPKDRHTPLERAFHSAVVVGDYMVVHGGYTHRHMQEEICYDNQTYLYHLKCQKWIDSTNLTKEILSDSSDYGSYGLFAHVMAVRHGHTVLVHGGYSGVMHSTLKAFILPPSIAGPYLLDNPCQSYETNDSCISDLACGWCTELKQCIERKKKKTCNNFISDACPGLCSILSSCHSCLIWGDPVGINVINDEEHHDNFPSPFCSWVVEDSACLSSNEAMTFQSNKVENNAVTPTATSPAHWWGPNQTIISALKECSTQDFPPGVISIKYRHPINLSQPDAVALLRRATEELHIRSELSLRSEPPRNETLDLETNVVKFLAFLHPFHAKPLSERMSRLQLFMCNGGSSMAQLRLSNDSYFKNLQVVARHATKSNYICTGVKRPQDGPLFPDNGPGFRYLFEFIVNVSAMYNDTANIQLAWNSFSIQPEAINYQYLEPYKNASCYKHTNCLACLTDNDCAWCSVDSSCQAKINTSESMCQLNDETHFFITNPNECALCSDFVYCSLCSQNPLCEWLVDAAYCVRRGRFKYSVRNPSFCPTSCHKRTNCTSCLMDPGICAWCEATQTCFLFSTYTTSYMFGLCRDWVDEHRYEPNGNPVELCRDCSRYRSCKQCLQHLSCGWCSFEDDALQGICTQGDFSEPTGLSCVSQLQQQLTSNKSIARWSYATCPDIEECLLGLHDCHPNATCTNTPESFKCTCDVGFKGDGKDCIRACAVQCVSGYCSESPDYKCICDQGWTGEDCGIDCGCHNHSTCINGPGLCDNCDKWTEGQFCERCSPGSFGSAVSSIGCQRCNCNDHGDPTYGYCNVTTGICYCKDNAEGPNCTKCRPGYYGKPKNGGYCYEECKPRGVITDVIEGRLGSFLKSGVHSDCLWLLSSYSKLDMESLLLPMPNPDTAIELVIEEDMRVPCPHNHIYVYDGLPDFIAPGHPNVLLGSFCGSNLSEPLSVIATSGYLTVHFKHSGLEEGFNARYRLLENFFVDNQTCLPNNCENYSININYNAEYCPNNCSASQNRGTCFVPYGKCVCNPGMEGDDCSIPVKQFNLIWTSVYNYAQALEWDSRTPLGRIGHSLFALEHEAGDSDNIWLFGGYSPRAGELNDMYYFDSLGGTWVYVHIHKPPPARYFHAQAIYKEVVFIYGGLTSKDTLGDFWAFLPEKMMWYELSVPDELKPMAGCTLTSTEDGYLYLIGGISKEYGFFDKVLQYDAPSNSWRFINTTGTQPIGIYGHSSVYHKITQSIYIFGGVSYEGASVEVSNKLYAFVPATQHWSHLPPDIRANSIPTRPQPRYFHIAVATKYYMVILGGRGPLNSKQFPKPYGYMFSCNAWISLTDDDISIVSAPKTKFIAAAAAYANVRIYIYSGYDGELETLAIPYDMCHLYSSGRNRCILHVGCAFCNVYEYGHNETFCYSQAHMPPVSCYNPKVSSEVVPAVSCNSAWIEKRECMQYTSCSDCLAAWPVFGEAKQVCQWCSNCKISRCVPAGTSCDSENDCNIPRKVINDTAICPARKCLASDCNKCLDIGDCIWTRQVQRLSGFGHNLHQKPIYNWVCVVKEIQDTPPFPIKSMPPLKCPQPCSKYTNCTSCLQSAGGEGGWHECIWSETLQSCMSPSYELLRCEDGTCGPIIQGNSSQCPLPCWHHEQASHCLSHAVCGWCAFTETPKDGWGLCIEGGIMGPTGGYCTEKQVLLLGTQLPPSVAERLASSKGPPRWAYLIAPPENECINGHHTCDDEDQVCVDTPMSFECDCKAGYERKNDGSGKCQPICRQGCLNGTCVQPDNCKCNFGFVSDNCSIACKCYGHSNCPGPDQLDVCSECYNETQGPHCQSCKPFFVGNPMTGIKCIPCIQFCHGHSSMCLNSDLLTTNSTIVTQPYNRTHVRLSLINNAEMMRQLFESPLLQTILNNPEYMRLMILNHPEIQDLMEKNKDVGVILNDPELFRETVEIIRNPTLLQDAINRQEKPIPDFHMSELLEKISEGSWSDAVCIDCQNNTHGKRCDQCLMGFFKSGDTFESGCRPCECHGHGDNCNPFTGEGCNCQNNTENDRQCTQKNAKNIITPCWQLQCSKCKEYFLGAPAHGHQCYRHMFLDKDYCFDPNTQEECNREPSSLPEGRTVFFAVQPRYMNVDIRIVVDVTDGGVDFLLSAKEDTFVVDVNKTSGIHYIAIDRKYGVDLRRDFDEMYHGTTDNKISKRDLESSNFTEPSSTSYLYMTDADSKALTTYITVKKSQEFLLVRNLQNRLIITIPQEVHDLRSTRFYMVLRGVGSVKVSATFGNLFFRQDQTRIDLFVFFSVFFSCFFLFLAICVVIWKVKQAFDVRRARRLHAAEMKHMASRPFGHVLTIVEDEVDDYDFLFYSPTNCRKKTKHGKVYGRDSPKPNEDRHTIRPIAVEPLSNGTAAVATVLVQLPGGAQSLVKMTLASAMITTRSSQYHVGYGIRAVMRRRTSHANV